MYPVGACSPRDIVSTGYKFSTDVIHGISVVHGMCSTGYNMCPTGYNPQCMCCPRDMWGIDTATGYQFASTGYTPGFAMDIPLIPWTTYYIPWTTSVISRGAHLIIYRGCYPVEAICGYIPWTPLYAPTGYVHGIYPDVHGT